VGHNRKQMQDFFHPISFLEKLRLNISVHYTFSTSVVVVHLRNNFHYSAIEIVQLNCYSIFSIIFTSSKVPLATDFQLHCNKSYHLKWTMTTNRYSRVPWCCPLNSIFNHSLNRWMIVGRVCFMSWSEVKDFTSSSFKRRATSKHFPT